MKNKLIEMISGVFMSAEDIRSIHRHQKTLVVNKDIVYVYENEDDANWHLNRIVREVNGES